MSINIYREFNEENTDSNIKGRYMPGYLDQDWDKQTYHYYEIFSDSPADLDLFHSTTKQRMTQLYEGWNNEIHRSFDCHSRFFVSVHAKDGRIGATLRVTYKHWRGRTYDLPCESADHGSKRYDHLRVAEISTLTFTNYEECAGIVASAAMAIQADLDCFIALRNPHIKSFMRFNEEYLNCTTIQDENIVFESFRNLHDHQPTEWELIKNPLPLTFEQFEKLLHDGGTSFTGVTAVPFRGLTDPQFTAQRSSVKA